MFDDEMWSRTPVVDGQSYVIFCIGDNQHTIQAFHTWMAMQGIPYKPLLGCRNGKSEQSFGVREADFWKVHHWTKQQENILLIGPRDMRGRRSATLRFQNGMEIDFGVMLSCSRDHAFALPSWTYDPTQQAYFVCSKAVANVA